ncbi:unnamed protein product [Eretmochelys imbricata]
MPPSTRGSTPQPRPLPLALQEELLQLSAVVGHYPSAGPEVRPGPELQLRAVACARSLRELCALGRADPDPPGTEREPAACPALGDPPARALLSLLDAQRLGPSPPSRGRGRRPAPGGARLAALSSNLPRSREPGELRAPLPPAPRRLRGRPAAPRVRGQPESER